MFTMTFSDDQKDLQKMVREFAQKKVAPVALELDRDGTFPKELFDELIAMGLHCLPAPEEFDGPELDSLTSAIITEELAKADVGFATTACANGLASYPVILAGTKEQQKIFFDIVMAGKMAAFALTEPNAGSDAGAVATTAKLDGDEYVLNGTKCFITNGGLADVYTVFATVDRSKGLKGLCAFLVERNRPGISVGKEEDKMGIRNTNTTDVIFQDVRIPKTHLLGKEGEGFKIAMQTLDIARPIVGALGVGLSQAALDHSIKYAKERVQFGKPIAANQVIQFMLADMAIQTEAARALVYQAAYLKDSGQASTFHAAICKTFAGDTAMAVSTDAVQIFGGYGYSREYPVEKLMRDAKILQIFEGTNQVQRMVIAGQLLK